MLRLIGNPRIDQRAVANPRAGLQYHDLTEYRKAMARIAAVQTLRVSSHTNVRSP